MNYGNLPTKAKLNSFSSKIPQRIRHFGVATFKAFLVLAFILVIIGGFIGFGIVRGIVDSAPDISSINGKLSSDATNIYDSKGQVMQTLIMEHSNQKDISYWNMPNDLINAFVAIEDSRFFFHNGIDLKALLRTLLVDVTAGRLSEGAITITQQLIKNSMFNGGLEQTFGEKIERKIQEQYLALQLEQKFDKTIILEYYLNSINLGSNTLGVQAASKRYFNKDVSDLTLSECTVLAAIAQNPSLYNPIKHPDQNAVRRNWILDYMLKNNLITSDQYSAALADDVYSRIQTTTQDNTSISSTFSYYTDEVFATVLEDLQSKLGYTETQAYNLLYGEGLSIYTPMDPDIQAIADEEINALENYPITEFSMNYSLSILHADGTSDSYNETDVKNYQRNNQNKPAYKNIFNNEQDMNAAIEEFKSFILKKEDKITEEVISKAPQPQASMVIMDQSNGHVLALCGGRGEKTTNLTFNRSTDLARQPGSCFQVLTSFAPALDVAGNTLATTYYDNAFRIGDQNFVNWWGNQYMGYANMRQGIKYSMNIVAVKCMTQSVSAATGYDYASNFGISTLASQDRSPSLALGSITNGVTNLELTSAYATIANNGIYNKPVLYTKVVDRNGNVILGEETESHSVIKETTSCLLTNAMEDSISGVNEWVEYGIPSTGSLCQVDGMSIAGSSGFTPDSSDLWFIGYSPYVTCGIWSGYDESKTLESGDYHKKLWQKVMARIHEGKPDPGFPISEDLEEAKICSKSGQLAIESICNHKDSNSVVYKELFEKGSVPTNYCDRHVPVNICIESGAQAGESCPKDQVQERVYLNLDPLDTGGGMLTFDSLHALPKGLLQSICPLHQLSQPKNFSQEELQIIPNTLAK